jgi:hypothetical protein
MATNTTATSQNHNGTGSQNNFAISFAFLANTEVDVKVGGDLKTLGTHYNIVGSQVQFTSGNTPPSGTANIVLTRNTDISAKKVDFADGSVLTETDLDNNSDQILFAQQEFTNDFVKRDGSQTVTGNLVFEGATDDNNELTLAITNPTADRTITVPDITGTLITSADTGTVSNQMIADDAVTTQKINGLAVTEGRIASNAVSTAKIADGAVTSNKILDQTIVNGDISSSAAIAGTKIAPDFGSQNVVTTGTLGAGATTIGALGVTGNISVSGTVDGRDVAADGTKLDTIETNAKDDQTAAEIKTLLQSNKLTTNEIANNAITTALIAQDAVTSNSIANDAVAQEHIATNAIVTDNIVDNAVTADKIADAVIVTNSEHAAATANDTSFFTTSASDGRYFRQDSTETITSGATWSSSDSFIATTGAINARIIDLIDEVGGFTAIDSEQHFPNTNPQGATGQAAILSIQAATTTLTPSGTTVTISNGNLANNANITITGVTAAIPSGFGFLVESTSTLHTYSFHRLVPKATEVTTVANNITNIVNAGANVVDINNFADLYQISSSAPTQRADGSSLAEGDLWFDSSNDNMQVYNGTSFAAVTPTQGVLADIAIVSGAITYQEDLGLITNAVSTGSSNGSLDIVADILEDEVTFTVTAATGKFIIDGVDKPALTLYKGWTYTFDVSDASNASHPLRFSSGGSAYNTGVTVTGTQGQAGAKVQLVVPESQPTSFIYYCTNHSGMGNSITVKDDPIKTVSDDITRIQTVADNINNLNTVQGISSNVTTVAGIASNVTTVAGISSDVTAVAADATDIGAVASKATEIGRLGTADAVADLAILGTTAIVSDLDTLADISSNITTVAGISGNVTTVAGIASNVTAVAGNASNINSAVSNASNINSAVSNASNINAAVANASNITAVAGNATNINAVAGDAADIGAVAGKATEIGRLGTADAVADLAILGTNAIVSDMDTLADISSNITTVAGISANVTTVAGISANVTTVASNNSNVSTVASNITDVNTFANRYRIGSTNPTSSLDVGDLFFNTSANELRVYNGSAWQGGVTATGNFATTSGVIFTGDNKYNDNVKAKFGSDSDLQIFHNTSDSIINASGVGNIKLQDQGNTKLEITSTGISATGNIVVSGTVDGRDVATDGTKLDGIEANATADQTAAEIRTLVESASDSNVFTDADHSKLNGIEASATADQTASEIVSLISGQTIAPNVITTTNLTIDFGSIA